MTRRDVLALAEALKGTRPRKPTANEDLLANGVIVIAASVQWEADVRALAETLIRSGAIVERCSKIGVIHVERAEFLAACGLEDATPTTKE